jgi:transcriptional regulator with XRE-family HTH domain
MQELAEIEARRLAEGMDRTTLERAAGLQISYYQKLMAGTYAPRPGTLARLKLAILRWRLRQTTDEFELVMLYRLALALAASALGVAAAAAQAQDPARRATQSAEWRAGSEARALACCLLNSGLGLRQARVAQAAGVTKQAVQQACRKVEDMRSDPAFDAMVDGLTAMVTGEW